MSIPLVFLITSNVQPVPPVKGGATETLINILVEENEKYHLLDLIVMSAYDEEAEKLSKKFNYTKIIYYKNMKDIKNKLKLINTMSGYFIFKLIRFLLRKEIPNRYIYTVYRYAKRNNIDYIIAEGGKYTDYGIFSESFSEEQLYAHLHRKVIGDAAHWKIFKNAIACSSYIGRQYKGCNSNIKVHTLMNCADEANFTREADEKKIIQLKNKFNYSDSDFVVLYCGRVVPEKGVIELVNAVNSIINDNIKLLVIGGSMYKDSEKTAYVKKIEALASVSQGRVQYAGYVGNAELLEYVRLCKVWAVPSTYEEPAGLVAIEAMMSQTPLIVSNSGGLIEFANGECAYVVERGEALATNLNQAIQYLYNNKEQLDSMKKKGNMRWKQFNRENYYFSFCKIFLDKMKREER